MKEKYIHIIAWAVIMLVCFTWYGYWNWWTDKYFLKSLDKLASYFLLIMFGSFWFFIYTMLIFEHEEK